MGAKAGEFLIPKMSMDGLADYSRSSGYVKGDVSITYETKSCNYDRGRKFSVDAMDNEETAGIVPFHHTAHAKSKNQNYMDPL